MPYTSPGDVTTGTTITSAWGNLVGDATDYLANPPACRAYHNAAQSPANNTETALALNSERYDTNSMHDTVTQNSRITFTTAGLYVVNGSASWAANATGVRQIGIRLGGVTYIAVELELTPGGTIVCQQTISTTYKFTAGQYVELVAYQNSGAALAVNSTGNYSPEFAATWVGLG